MRKTIFRKMMWSTLLIMFIILVLLGTIMFTLFGTYAINDKTKTLQGIAENIANYTTFWRMQNSQVNSKDIYDTTLSALSEITNTDIVVVNTNGQIFASNLQASRFPPKISENYLTQALSGVPARFTGDFDGVFTEKVLTVALPIYLHERVIGVVFTHASMPGLQANRMMLFNMFIIISIFVFCIAFMVMYILSQKMTKSIKDISKAAQSLASGNYDTRAQITGDDEIAALGRTFNYMADSLQKLDDTQTAFIANVSHELRTPMTTIAGFTENILNGTIPPEQHKKYLQIVLDESNRLSRMVTNMLDISKMSLGQYSIVKSPFNLTEMLRLIIIQYESAIEEKHLDVSVEFSEDYIIVEADRDAITRVITNIIDNAIKFSDPGGRLDISAITRDGKAYVAIANEGEGIDQEDIGHVFDRFYKTDKSRNDKKGTGLGLYLVHNLLTLHGETIAVKSVDLKDEDFDGCENHPARRTTFVFSLTLGK